MRPRIKSEQKTAISATTTFEPQSHNIQQKQTPLVDNTEQPRQFKPVQQPPKISIQNRPLSPSNAISPAPQPRQTFTPPIPKATQPIPNANSTKSTPQTPNPEIQNIFESFGYIIKPCRKIGNLAAPTVALGYDNTLWIVASNVKFDDMQDAIQTLIALFDDTLGDAASDIIIHGCIIGGTEKSDNPELISTFTNMDALKQFISEHPNTKPDDFDSDLFDAISTYISTVMNYIGKE